jgi:hypothetical protein
VASRMGYDNDIWNQVQQFAFVGIHMVDEEREPVFRGTCLDRQL